MDIYILFRDMRTYGFKEDYYREAADKGVKLRPLGAGRTSPRWRPARTRRAKPVLRVTVPDPILGQRLALDADLVALSAAVVPSAGSPEIARLFKVPMNPDGFFQEAHVKLRPVDFAADGVFLCGTEPLSQAPHRDDQPGLRRGRPGRHPALPRHGHRLRLGLRGRGGRLHLLRGLHHGLHLRRDRLPRDAGGQEGRGQSRPLQGGRPLLRQVPDQRHRPEALHRRGGLQPDRRGAWRTRGARRAMNAATRRWEHDRTRAHAEDRRLPLQLVSVLRCGPVWSYQTKLRTGDPDHPPDVHRPGGPGLRAPRASRRAPTA